MEIQVPKRCRRLYGDDDKGVNSPWRDKGRVADNLARTSVQLWQEQKSRVKDN